MRNRTLLTLGIAAVLMNEAESQASAGAGAVEEMNDTLLDMDTVNDLSFDDMDEAPGFVQPPDGIYNLRLEKAVSEKYKTKEGQQRSRFSHFYEITKVVELSNPNEQAPAVGSKFSERFMHNEQGMKFWKSKVKAIMGEGAQGGGLTVANILKELSTGTYEFRARVSNKETQGKGVNKDKKYTNTNVRVMGKLQDPELA